MDIKNIRDMEVTTSSGKDVKDTEMLSGEAEVTSAEKATNAVKQYETGSTDKGALGGMPSGK